MYVSVHYFFTNKKLSMTPNHFTKQNVLSNMFGMTIQILTTALSIENGSGFERENQFSNSFLQENKETLLLILTKSD